MLVRNGTIVALGPDKAVPTPEQSITVNLPNAVLLPGMVNVHTHLELSGLDTIQNPSFYEWIQTVRAEKDRLRPADFIEAAKRGIRDAWRDGTTAVGDTGDSGAPALALAELGGRGVVFLEVFGPHPDQVDESFAGLVDRLASFQSLTSDLVKIGVSPHAPFTVSGPLYQRVADLARAEGYPIAVHIAESRAEVDLLTLGTGPFATAWRRRGIQLPNRVRSPLEYLDQWRVLDAAPLAIHAVQVDDEDIGLLSDHGCAVASCPVSNRRHGHGDAPLHRLREAGIRIGIGTDSVASVGTIDLRRDGRRAQELLRISSAEVIEMLTLGGARALGLADRIGSLEVGKRADLCAIELQEGVSDLANAILTAPTDAVLRTWVEGRLVYQRDQEVVR